MIVLLCKYEIDYIGDNIKVEIGILSWDELQYQISPHNQSSMVCNLL